ncbi:MAG: hypothetical protein V1886_03295 [archaeon]
MNRKLAGNLRCPIFTGLLALILLLASTGVYAIQDLLALQGSVTTTAGANVNNGNLTVLIYDNATAGSLIYNSSTDYYSKINAGRFDVMLGDGSVVLSLILNKIYYMDILVNNENLNFSGNDRQIFQSPVGTAAIKVGNQTMTGLCPTGWVMVPGNASLGTTDFCVMKYEAKNRDGVPQSISDGTPWVSINQPDSAGNCSRIGAHLCTATEAQTISRNIEAQAANWKNNVIGTCMYGGHVDNDPANALAASTDNNPYSGTNDAATDTFECPFDTTVGASDGKEQRRTFNLSNGEVIWDWSGNVYEWLANTCTGGTGAGNWDATAAWQEWTAAAFNDYERPTLGPSSSLWDANNGTGRYYGCTANGNAFLRGGHWGSGAYAGVFNLYLDGAPSYVNSDFGFRCCMVP